MKFSPAAVLASLVAAANAKVAFTNAAFDVTPGKPFTLTWSGNTGDVTIVLATGSSTDLEKVETIDTGDSGSSYTWKVPTDLPTGVYAFEITDSETTNYSVQFSLFGTSASSSAVTASSTATSATSASASTAASSSAASSSSASSASSSAASSAASSSAASSSAASSSASSSSSATTSTGSSTATTTSHSTTKSSSSSTTLSTSSKTTSSSTSATATATSSPANTNNGIKEKSPLAFILVTVATLMYFN